LCASEKKGNVLEEWQFLTPYLLQQQTGSLLEALLLVLFETFVQLNMMSSSFRLNSPSEKTICFMETTTREKCFTRVEMKM
jgi:hypothetical protein